MSDQTALESERDFLLRSLDDLESERDAGNIDDETYRTLHEDYTARAAIACSSVPSPVASAPVSEFPVIVSPGDRVPTARVKP